MSAVFAWWTVKCDERIIEPDPASITPETEIMLIEGEFALEMIIDQDQHQG